MDIFEEFDKPLSEDIKDKINGCFANYIFYQREDRAPADPLTGMRSGEPGYICFCTRCRREFRASYADMCGDGETKKHHDRAKCPLCGREGTMWHNGRGKKCLSERELIVVFRKIDHEHIIAQGYYAYKAYNGDPRARFLNVHYSPLDWDRDPGIELDEVARYSFAPGEAHFWRQSWNAWSGPAWYEERRTGEPFRPGFYGGYESYWLIGREEVLGASFMKYCADDLYAHAPGNAQRLMSYYAHYAQHPICEMLLKLGLYDIVTDAVDAKKEHKRLLNWEAKTPPEFFRGLTRQEFAEIIKAKPRWEAYEFFRKAHKALGLTFAQAETVRKAFLAQPDTVLNIMQRHGLTLTRLDNYLTRQAEYSGASSISSIFIVYRDYLDIAENLHYDLSSERVKMPKMLADAHDAAVKTLNAMQRDTERKEMQKLTARLKKRYSFEHGGLMIVVPATMQDIINEGKALSHCVGGYAERHARGVTTILFLRRKTAPSVPFFTIEVGRGWNGKQPPHIVQCHGYKNERGGAKPAEVKEFEKEFGAFIKNPRKYKKEHKKAV